LAVSDWLKALAGLRMNCGQLGAHPELIRRHSTLRIASRLCCQANQFYQVLWW